MPAKPRWLLHIPAILEQLRALDVPVVDRAMCERMFGVGRRRAIGLLQSLGGYRTGNAVLIDRLELISRLEAVLEGRDAQHERKRKARLASSLDQLHRFRAAHAVEIAVAPETWVRKLPELPPGVVLDRGQLVVAFRGTEELLQRLFELAQTAANDYEAFQAAVEARAAA